MHQARATSAYHNSIDREEEDNNPFKLKPRKQPLLSIPHDKITFVQKEK
jgi:hypothetical protein